MLKRHRHDVFWLFAASVAVSLAVILSAGAAVAQGRRGKLLVRVVDSQTKQPVAARMKLTNERGGVVRPAGTVMEGDWFYIDGEALLELQPRQFQFILERGPEYRIRTGRFALDRDSDDLAELEMVRFAQMSEQGWWSGDLDVSKRSERIELLMRAEDLHVALLVAPWKQDGGGDETASPGGVAVRFGGDRLYGLLAARDDRDLGGLTMLSLRPSEAPQAVGEQFPTTVAAIRQGHAEGDWHIDAPHAAVADLPVWVAAGLVDSVGLLSDQLYPTGATGWDEIHRDGQRTPDPVLFPPPQGPARWAEKIYYHLLNSGLQTPPTAGGSQRADSPLGYNRVYVYCGEEFTYEKWWEGLRAGRVVVTNGPMLTLSVLGQRPGHVFRAQYGETVELPIGLTLKTRDPIAYLEIVQNGRSTAQVRLDDYEKSGGRLPPLVFRESGWFLVRAVADDAQTYRAATSGPYYVQFDGRPRISRESVQFFLDWIDERAGQAAAADPARRESALRIYERAREYWRGLLEKANAP